MKKAFFTIGIGLAFHEMVKAQDSEYLRHLKAQDSIRHAEVSRYLKAHPKAKAKYRDRRGRYVFLHHIDAKGKPIYYVERRK